MQEWAWGISVVSLAVSGVTAWLTLFHRGTIKMTKPAVIYFGHDSGGKDGLKVYLRTLLFSTSRRGRLIESMHVNLRRGESTQVFNIWVHGDKDLTRGSGLFVGSDGVGFNHHFLLPPDGTPFAFVPGVYRVDVYAQLVNERAPLLLSTQTVELSAEFSEAICKRQAGVYFDWGPGSATYTAHIKKNEAAELNWILHEKAREPAKRLVEP